MGMDRKIKKKTWTTGRILAIGGGLAVLSLVLYSFLFADNRSKLNVDAEKITVSEVKRDVFQENIPETGIVMPSQTIYLDAVEGGVVKDITLESGALVEKGDTIMTLANSNLQLDVLQREAQLYEQLNILRTTRLQLDQNDLNQKAQLAEIDYQIQLLKPQYARFKELAGKKLISQRELEEVEEQYKYNVRRQELTYKAYQSDSIARSMQLNQIRSSEDRMLRSMEGVGEILGNLVITAPTEGLLTTSDWEPGQSINPGERLGQVALLDAFKVRVAIDELYLPRVDVGQQGTFSFAGKHVSSGDLQKVPHRVGRQFRSGHEICGRSARRHPARTVAAHQAGTEQSRRGHFAGYRWLLPRHGRQLGVRDEQRRQQSPEA